MLHYAVWAGWSELVEELLAAGGDPLRPAESGETALDLAKELADEKMLFVLQSPSFRTKESPAALKYVLQNNYMEPESRAVSLARW